MTAVAPSSLSVVRSLVEPTLRAAVDRLNPQMRRVAAYHMGWIEYDGTPAENGGKALRPALALLSARAAGAPAETGVPGAAAVELVHAFSLLHDDIMDGDRTRRHRPAAWTLFGSSAAILGGDALLTLAVEVLLEQGTRGGYWAARGLTAAAQRLIAGQSLDLEFEQRDDVTLDECLSMSGDKTASLLACSCSVGAMLAEAPADLVTALTDFGAQLGLAFQLIDDLLGIWGSPEVTGKPVLSDLRSRKKSLPVVAALTAGVDASTRLAELLAGAEPLSEDDLRLAARLVEDSGGRAWAEEEAERRLTKATDRLKGAEMPDAVREEFLDLTRFVTARDR
ncbi:MAG TPA: polyprenyl synthetase family protein [Streptosporangiaceae bacterium]